MDEHNSDQINSKKETEFSDFCTSLVPDDGKSVIPARTDHAETPPETEESFPGHDRRGIHRLSGWFHGFSGKFRNISGHSTGWRRQIFRRIFLFSGIALLALVILSGVSVAYLIAAAPDIDALTVSPSESATYIYDQDGTILRKLTLSSSNREIVSLDEIPQSLQNAIVAIEDERFFEHGGIDLRGIARAFLNGLAKGRFSEGASTITQQLIKNSVFTEWTQENSFLDRLSRKIQEQYLAVRLENQLSKEEILEDYLNIINFGSGCYGAQAASRRYFGKPASELSLSESAVLAAIPQNPTAMNPINFPENNNRRRMIVLNYMEEQGYITAEQHEKALTDNVYDRIREYDASYEGNSVYTYYEDALIDQVIDLLTGEKGYTYDQAYRAVYSGGLRIVSAQDQRIQDICDQEFTNTQNFPADTLYGVDYALSVADADGIVTHYGQEHLKSYVRENFDPSFNLMCQDTDTVQKYADAFREATLASCQDSGSNRKDGSTDSNKDGNTNNDSSDSNKNGSSNADNTNNSSSGNNKDNDSSDDSSGSPDSNTNTPRVLAERLTFSPQPQASVVIIDQSTGFVRAVVGGRGEKTASLTLNRATETTRQPGSTFKILTAYAPALDVCGQTLATEYENQPYKYQDGTPVSNWDLNDYSGPTSIRDAIARSINVIAVQCITEVTPRLGFQYAQKFGISTLHETYESGGNYSSDIVQPLALGGITQGVSNLELCGAYATIADGGIYHKPKFFTQITDRHGNIIVDYTKTNNSDKKNKKKGGNNKTEDESDGIEVIKPSTAWLLTDAMKDVVTSESGTAYGLISAGTMPVAGKTGTTSSYKDIWFAGYTPYYTCCVWGGYDNNDSLPDSSTYHTYNKTLWSSIMTRIHASLPAKDFERPDNIVAVKLCSESNLPAVEKGCTDIRQEFFKKGTEPSGKCPLHKPAPETEKNIIYQDILDELFPKTGETDKLLPENDDTDKSFSETEGTDKLSQENKESDKSLLENDDTSKSFLEDEGTDKLSQENRESDKSLLENDDTDKPLSENKETEEPFPETKTEDSETPEDSDSGALENFGSEPSDAPDSEEEPLNTGNQASDPSAGQPQTTSLDDMIDQLTRYGLP